MSIQDKSTDTDSGISHKSLTGFTLTITNVENVLFHGQVKSVTVPGSEGEMTILPNHMSFVSGLKNGQIIVKGENDNSFKIEKGVIKVSPEEVLILV